MEIKTRKEVWFRNETIELVEHGAEKNGINHSQFTENCILEHFGKTSHINRKATLSDGEIDLLKILYENEHSPFYISVLEDHAMEGNNKFSKRSVREIIKKFFKLGLIDKVKSEKNKKFKCFSISKKGKKAYEKL